MAGNNTTLLCFVIWECVFAVWSSAHLNRLYSTMNLYEVLSRKIYLSSNQQRRRAHTISSAEEEPHNEDQPPKRKRVQRDSTLSRNPSIPKFQRPSYISRNRKLEDDEYDLLDASNSYRRYRLLSAANSEHARTECRAYFETIVSQVDRIKLAIVCFACFHVVGTILEVVYYLLINISFNARHFPSSLTFWRRFIFLRPLLITINGDSSCQSHLVFSVLQSHSASSLLLAGIHNGISFHWATRTRCSLSQQHSHSWRWTNWLLWRVTTFTSWYHCHLPSVSSVL